ncbi:MAG: MmgE/PrpD family protein [Solirubrobacteraceae bacterium]
MTLTKALAQRALEPPAEPVRDQLRLLTLGNLAAAAGDLGAAGRLIERLLPADHRSPADAARRWGMTLHARTQDDFFPHGRVHVGAATLATALALEDAVGDRLLECLAAGYDVMCRVSAAYSGVAQRRGMRPTGMFGPLGAAATAAVAMNLGEDGVANAIGLAATMSAGTNQAWLSGTDEWLLELGAAARAGVEAGELTAAGATASPQALEGAAGWARAFFHDDGARALAERMEEVSGVLDVATKPYPVSGIAEVPTWLACRAHLDLQGAAPDSIAVGVSEAEATYPGSANRGPFRSRSDALMSLAFCVACGITDGLVPLGRLERPGDAGLAHVIERVELQPRGDLAETEATLTVTAGDRCIEIRGAGADVLYPSWHGMDADSLAARNEAGAGLVRNARDELMRDAPSARSVKDLLKGEPCRVASNPSSAASTS